MGSAERLPPPQPGHVRTHHAHRPVPGRSQRSFVQPGQRPWTASGTDAAMRSHIRQVGEGGTKDDPARHKGGSDRVSTARSGARDGRPPVTSSAGTGPDGAGVNTRRSPGAQSRAAHRAARVDSFTCDGCFVNRADTEAGDRPRPAFSASSRRSWVPVHTPRSAAVIRSRHSTPGTTTSDTGDPDRFIGLAFLSRPAPGQQSR